MSYAGALSWPWGDDTLCVPLPDKTKFTLYFLGFTWDDSVKLCMSLIFLPPVYEVRGKVLFSQVSVCPYFGRGVPHPADGGAGTPSSWWGGGTPSQVQAGEYPIQLTGGVPHPRSRWGPSRTGWGTPPPSKTGWGNPPSPHQEIEQHSEQHLLRDGRYASCVHAGGFSC